MTDLLDKIRQAKLYDLAQPYFVGMPHYPTHPPFLFGLTKKHGDLVLEGGVSSAADSIALGSHVGTHIDALCHFSCGGKLHGGMDATAVQSDGGGIREHSVDNIAPILRRGVLLDIAGRENVDALATEFSIGADRMEDTARLQGVEIRKGDVVLLRTGWARYWNDPVRYVAGGKGAVAAGPGPELEGARWLSRQGVYAVGSDTIAFEKVPNANMPVHVHLLVENGIHIIEALNLEELARDRVYEFVFMATPLKIRGGTGSPIRPIALS
jgi:kynurenine formamidase